MTAWDRLVWSPTLKDLVFLTAEVLAIVWALWEEGFAIVCDIRVVELAKVWEMEKPRDWNLLPGELAAGGWDMWEAMGCILPSSSL